MQQKIFIRIINDILKTQSIQPKKYSRPKPLLYMGLKAERILKQTKLCEILVMIKIYD